MNKYEIYSHDENFSLTTEILAGSITRASELAKDAFISKYSNSKRENIVTSLSEGCIQVITPLAKVFSQLLTIIHLL